MATKKRPDQPARNPDGTTVKHNVRGLEVREASGIGGRLVSDLPRADVAEIIASYAMDGADALKTKYGLTSGEVSALIRDPQVQRLLLDLARAQRIQAVARLALSVPRLLDKIDASLDSATLSERVGALVAVKDALVEIGGIEQRRSLRLDQAGHPDVDAVLAPADPDSSALVELRDRLVAMHLAGVEVKDLASGAVKA